jgi:hypothetical protein
VSAFVNAKVALDELVGSVGFVVIVDAPGGVASPTCDPLSCQPGDLRAFSHENQDAGPPRVLPSGPHDQVHPVPDGEEDVHHARIVAHAVVQGADRVRRLFVVLGIGDPA